MIDQNLKEYIKNKRAKGLEDHEIKQKLLTVGWSEPDINIGLLNEDDIPLPNHKPTLDHTISSPPIYEPRSNLWDVFEHFILFISLYIFSISLAFILHELIDKYLPNTELYGSSYGYNSRSYSDGFLTGYAAALIVTFPIFALTFRDITSRTLKNPSLRRERSRKILTYLTLFVSFLILIVQAITTVYTFLNGNVTLNFFAHFFINCAVTGSIFGYYFNEVKEDRKLNNI